MPSIVALVITERRRTGATLALLNKADQFAAQRLREHICESLRVKWHNIIQIDRSTIARPDELDKISELQADRST